MVHNEIIRRIHDGRNPTGMLHVMFAFIFGINSSLLVCPFVLHCHVHLLYNNGAK